MKNHKPKPVIRWKMLSMIALIAFVIGGGQYILLSETSPKGLSAQIFEIQRSFTK